MNLRGHLANPRKTLRKNINFLRAEKARIEARAKKFQAEIDRITKLEREGTNEEVINEADRWKDYHWYAFPEEF